jgi:hypothetical protein
MDLADELLEALSFEILPPDRPWRPFELEKRHGFLCRKAEWTCLSAAES